MKYLAIAFIAAMLMTSCNKIGQISMESAKMAIKTANATHEYRDSEKWGKVTEKMISNEETFFNAIQVNGNVEVILTQDTTCTIKAIGNEKAIEEYQFMFNTDSTTSTTELVANLKNYTWNANKSVDAVTPAITLEVSAPSLHGIVVYGAASIKVKSDIKQNNDFTVRINGTGDVDTKKLDIENLYIEINGAGDIKIKEAKCQGNATFQIDGAGDADADIECANLKTIVNGAGDINFKVKCNELQAECNGAGDIKLKGECHTLIKSDGPLGGIDSRELKTTKVDIR